MKTRSETLPPGPTEAELEEARQSNVKLFLDGNEIGVEELEEVANFIRFRRQRKAEKELGKG